MSSKTKDRKKSSSKKKDTIKVRVVKENIKDNAKPIIATAAGLGVSGIVLKNVLQKYKTEKEKPKEKRDGLFMRQLRKIRIKTDISLAKLLEDSRIIYNAGKNNTSFVKSLYDTIQNKDE